MSGFITEENFEECERTFPGIIAFYNGLAVKPRTFLELMAAFLKEEQASAVRERITPSSSRTFAAGRRALRG